MIARTATLVRFRCRRLVGVALIGGALVAAALPPRSIANAGGADPPRAAFPLRFDSERIRLHIMGDTLEVRGTYVLLCHSLSAGSIPLFYPFPEDSMLGGARMVSLSVRVPPGEGAPARWDAIPGGRVVRWWMPPCTGDTLVVESIYRQRILGEYARYIVTTTRYWGHPLRRARFEIHLPDGAVPTEFSFPFTKRAEGETYFYAFEADSFFPDRDIVVRWKR